MSICFSIYWGITSGAERLPPEGCRTRQRARADLGRQYAPSDCSGGALRRRNAKISGFAAGKIRWINLL